MLATSECWQFWMDVGGTFTDCLAIPPSGEPHILKILSSGRTKAELRRTANSPDGTDTTAEILTNLTSGVTDFWAGYELSLCDESGQIADSVLVVASNTAGQLVCQRPVKLTSATRLELSSGEGAPLLAIRLALQLPLSAAIPPVVVRLGTTRGTNALLTRRGAKTALVTTRGFADVLRIANQDRPRLFELAIQKPDPLFLAVAEIDERLTADGQILLAPTREQIQAALVEVRNAGCESLAICLLHAFANPVHEELVAEVAREQGFESISVSNRLSPLIKIVSRADTTVMDAYLNPILQSYISQLSRKLSGSELKLMTSSGGLVAAERFTGKESVLSGPAGGVIGFAKVAEQAGFRRAIGFDMGGTSTDVARYDGRYEYEFETTKAGVRIVTPMLAIETVAAGGGSICGFDGVKLYVGPESAGSDPGPACYGRGGPLTVTDCNVILGRVPVQTFPFALDIPAVQRRLDELIPRIAASQLGRQYQPQELAAGFLEIANATMARAIRKVSVAKGYDPAEYVLVPFGGAGGQHACALAGLLGMSRILVHPWAGVLSAYGIGQADVKRFRQQAVLSTYSAQNWQELQPLVQRLSEDARAEVFSEGVAAADVQPPEISLELRYRGVEATISIPQPEDGDFALAYEQRHRQYYGYVRPGRELEMVSLRVEVVGRNSRAQALTATATTTPTGTATSTAETAREPQLQSVWMAGEQRAVPLWYRSQLTVGQLVAGPAILAESTSTLVIDPGFEAVLQPAGEWLISRVGTTATFTEQRVNPEEQPMAAASSETAAPVDPVQLELFHQTFTSFAEQMGVTLQNTSVSTNVKERLDFSCAIFDPQGGLVVNAPHIPVHLGAMSETVRWILRDNPDMTAGDVYVTNDPYRGGSHLPDVTVVTPVHHPHTGELLFLTASRAHHAEIGGIVPGSMPPFSRNLGEEGVLIRNFRLLHQGESAEEALETLLKSGAYPSRNVADNLADLRAQVAANQMGAQLLLQLVDARGATIVGQYMRHLQAAAAAAMRQALGGLTDGVYRFVDHLDDGSPIAVAITVAGERATIDFSGTGPVLASNLNANRAIVTAAVMYALRCLLGASSTRAATQSTASTANIIPRELPLNGGVLEPITLLLPECLLNPPEHTDAALCPAMVGGNVETSQRTVDVLLGAFGLAAASQGTMNNLTFGDGTFGYYETICGGSGATAEADGASAVHTHMTNTRLTDPEVIERRYPVRLREFSIRRGSGGAGQHCGGDGVRRVMEFLRPVRVSLLTERRGPYAPYGLNGGQPGQCGRNTLVAAQGDRVDLGGKASFDAAPGDVIILETPGGGGYGSP